MTVTGDLLGLPPLDRRAVLAEHDTDDIELILRAFDAEFGTPFYGYWDDPVGFGEDVLGEFFWSGQKRILEAGVRNKRTCVVASHGPGKTHCAARSVAHVMCCYRPGSAVAVTTAPRWRQVKNLLWPHLHRLMAAHPLPGTLNLTEWKHGPVAYGYGFAGNAYDEAAVQGIHADETLLIVVDEAGGIHPDLGRNLDSLLAGGDAHILAIGNPPTDSAGSWFESIAENDLWVTIPISAFDTPNFTGEWCPPEISRRLVDQVWVDDIVAQYGVDDPYYIARVLARFPKVASRRVIPVLWCEDAMVNTDRPDSDWQRLGVDVAGGGGDEMVIAHADGWEVRILDTWSGADSVNQVVNADRVRDQILHVAAIQDRKGYREHPVRVKIDSVGIGAGTADILEAQGKAGEHPAEIVRVNAGEAATEHGRFINRRAEMWWTLREAIRDHSVWLRVSETEKRQLTGPMFTDHLHGGRTAIETKDHMKARGLPSPDRADAICMAVYEPVPVVKAESYTAQISERRLPERIGVAAARM